MSQTLHSRFVKVMRPVQDLDFTTFLPRTEDLWSAQAQAVLGVRRC